MNPLHQESPADIPPQDAKVVQQEDRQGVPIRRELPTWVCPPVPYTSTETGGTDGKSSKKGLLPKRRDHSNHHSNNNSSGKVENRFRSIFSRSHKRSLSVPSKKRDDDLLPELFTSSTTQSAPYPGPAETSERERRKANSQVIPTLNALLENSCSSNTQVTGNAAALYLSSLQRLGSSSKGETPQLYKQPQLSENGVVPLLAPPAGNTSDGVTDENKLLTSSSLHDSLLQKSQGPAAQPKKNNFKWHSYVKEQRPPVSNTSFHSSVSSFNSSLKEERQTARLPRSTVTHDSEKTTERAVSWKQNVLSPDKGGHATPSAHPSILQTNRSTALPTRPSKLLPTHRSKSSTAAPPNRKRSKSPKGTEKENSLNSEFAKALQNGEFGNQFRLHLLNSEADYTKPEQDSPLTNGGEFRRPTSPDAKKKLQAMTSNKRESFTPLALGMFSSSESATQPPKNVSILGKQSFNSSQRTEGESSNRVIVHSPTSPVPRKGTGSTSDQSASPVMFDWAGDVINGTSSNGLVDAGSFSAGVLSSKSASPFRLRKSSGRVGQYFNANTSEISGENKEENRMNPASRTSSSNMIGNII